jgi:signal recognition particle GTPase
MVMDAWGESLKNILKKIAKTGHIDKELIKEIVRDIQRSLADKWNDAKQTATSLVSILG